jgi:hypothetical protein
MTYHNQTKELAT